MNKHRPLDRPPHEISAIKKLDGAISSHPFQPEYILVGTGLMAALEGAGRLSTLKIRGESENNVWLLNEEIVVLENTDQKDEYGFHLQPEPRTD
jgi:hypothetical protein